MQSGWKNTDIADRNTRPTMNIVKYFWAGIITVCGGVGENEDRRSGVKDSTGSRFHSNTGYMGEIR